MFSGCASLLSAHAARPLERMAWPTSRSGSGGQTTGRAGANQPEPTTYIRISVRHAHPEGEHGGEIREGFYDSFDGKVIVTDTRGKLIGRAADYGNPAAVARTILRKHIADQPKPLRI